MIDPKLTTLSDIFADADAAAWNVARECARQPEPSPRAEGGANDDEVFEFLIDLDAAPASEPMPHAIDVPEQFAAGSSQPVQTRKAPREPQATALVPEHAAAEPELTPLLPATNASPASSAYMRKRAALHGEALDALTLAVRRIREGLEDDADFDDAIKAAPILHKHIEHFERLAAGQAQRDGAQMVHARFGFDKRGEYFVALELVQPDDVTDPLHAAE